MLNLKENRKKCWYFEMTLLNCKKSNGILNIDNFFYFG